MPLWGYPPISESFISTTAYQTFLFVADSIKLDRACSSDVYSILRSYKNESWDNFYDGLCYSRELLIVILVHAPNSAMWLLL